MKPVRDIVKEAIPILIGIAILWCIIFVVLKELGVYKIFGFDV